MFGSLRDWNKKYEKKLSNENPFLRDLYIGARLTKIRTDDLRKRLSISPIGEKNREINAFYLGAIEGDVRKYMNMSNMDMDQLIQIVMLVALYTATKDRDISSDGEWGALARDYSEVFVSEYDKYRKAGIGFSGLFNAEAEGCWDDLETMLKGETPEKRIIPLSSKICIDSTNKYFSVDREGRLVCYPVSSSEDNPSDNIEDWIVVTSMKDIPFKIAELIVCSMNSHFNINLKVEDYFE